MSGAGLASRLVRRLPSIRRAHEQYASAATTRAAMTALRAGPPTFAPPARFSRRVDVTREADVDGWPVYAVTRRRDPAPGRLVFLHGGAYFRELRPWHWRFVAGLAARTGLSVTVPIYPLAPEGTAAEVVPVAVRLTRAAVRAAGGDPVLLVGDSAGAGMALAVAQELPAAERAALAGLVLVSPWVDVACDDPEVLARAPVDPWLQPAGLREAGDAYRGRLPRDHPHVSPVHGDLAGLPPALVLTGTHDILGADAHRLVRELAAVGVPVELVEAPGEIHDYPLLPTPAGRRARRRIAAWVTERAGSPGLSDPRPTSRDPRRG